MSMKSMTACLQQVYTGDEITKVCACTNDGVCNYAHCVERFVALKGENPSEMLLNVARIAAEFYFLV